MKKSSHSSVDGFILRKSGDKGNVPNRTIGEPSRELGDGSRPIEDQTATEFGSGIKLDIDSSLNAIDAETDERGKKRRSRRKNDNDPQKKRRRRIVKWVGIGLLIAGLIVVGYFAWKVLQTGGRIFSGNLLDVFQHQKLAEDSNGRTNILIFGTSGWSMDQNNGWAGGLLTDSIMVVSLDQDEGDMFTISLPRDLYVEHTCVTVSNTSAGRLNETYNCAYSDSGGDMDVGAKALAKTAGTITGLDVQYYVHANWTALEKGVNAVGGVDIKIESDDPRGIYDVATGINYKNGEVAHMDGKTALAFARARNSHGGYGLSGSNFDREKNQQKLLNALRDKAVSAGTLMNPAAVSGLLDALGQNLSTNFKASEVQALIDIARNTKSTTSLPFVGREDEPDLVKTGMVGSASVVMPVAGLFNYADIHKYIQMSIKSDELATVDVLNGSGTAGLALEKANALEEDGYTVGIVDNAPSEITDAVRIYQLNMEKTKAAEVLKQRYGVEIQEGTLADYVPSEGAEFIIIFGKTEQ